MPKRIQRSRAKGWKMPVGAVYVGRPTKWGNLYKVDESIGFDRDAAVDCFQLDCASVHGLIGEYPSTEEIQRELRGKDLVCWCPLDGPCHADVLLEIANMTVEP